MPLTGNTAGIDYRPAGRMHSRSNSRLLRSTTAGMKQTWFAVEDNLNKTFSIDDVKVSFYKDPKVGRVWMMSHSQLADLHFAIEKYLTSKQETQHSSHPRSATLESTEPGAQGTAGEIRGTNALPGGLAGHGAHA